MTNTHTATKWEARCETDGRTKTHYVKMPRGSCYLTRGVGESDLDVQNKARLISASPEMLSVLQAIADGWSSYTKEDQDAYEMPLALFDAMHAAISKATTR